MDPHEAYLSPAYYMSQDLQVWEIDAVFDYIPRPDKRDLLYAVVGLSLGVAFSLLLRRARL